LVVLRFLVRVAEEPLAPVGVVQPLVARRRTRDRSVEDLRHSQYGGCREGAAIAPAADADPAEIEVGTVLGGCPQRDHLVLQRSGEAVAVDRLLPGWTAPRGAAPVRDNDREAGLG